MVFLWWVVVVVLGKWWCKPVVTGGRDDELRVFVTVRLLLLVSAGSVRNSKLLVPVTFPVSAVVDVLVVVELLHSGKSTVRVTVTTPCVLVTVIVGSSSPRETVLVRMMVTYDGSSSSEDVEVDGLFLLVVVVVDFGDITVVVDVNVVLVSVGPGAGIVEVTPPKLSSVKEM